MSTRTAVFSNARQRALLASLVALAAAVIFGVQPVMAQSQDDAAPPLLAGRIALISGDVRIAQPTDANSNPSWDSAVVNDVVTGGTSVFTGAGSRTELRIGGHALRLDGSSQVAVVGLEDNQTQVQLQGGVLNVRWRDDERRARLVIGVPNGQVEISDAGRYRIDLHEDGATVTVFDGRAQIVQAGNVVPVEAGRALIASGGRFDFEPANPNQFDQWALDRDERTRVVTSTRYVSPLMTGYEELDANGRWDNDPSYGAVWVPTYVPAGWAPYRYGQWRFVHPWGWTWVDAAPWGFAPFHYGRWVSWRGGWGWAPGGYVARPVYAPALVGYVSEPGISVSFSIGHPPSAWYPLAPWQPYRPYYNHNNTYITNINRTVIINQPPSSVPINVNQTLGMTAQPVRYGRPAERGPSVMPVGAAPMQTPPQLIRKIQPAERAAPVGSPGFASSVPNAPVNSPAFVPTPNRQEFPVRKVTPFERAPAVIQSSPVPQAAIPQPQTGPIPVPQQRYGTPRNFENENQVSRGGGGYKVIPQQAQQPQFIPQPLAPQAAPPQARAVQAPQIQRAPQVQAAPVQQPQPQQQQPQVQRLEGRGKVFNER